MNKSYWKQLQKQLGKYIHFIVRDKTILGYSLHDHGYKNKSISINGTECKLLRIIELQTSSIYRNQLANSGNIKRLI